MKIKTNLLVIAAAAATLLTAADAQELLKIAFHGTCIPANLRTQATVPGNTNVARIANADLIALCVGNGFTTRDLKQNYQLVYNTAADSIQVINKSDNSAECDVFQFAGGSAVTNPEGISRLVFVFSPAQTEAIGSAVLTERTNMQNGLTRIIGRLQFTMPEAGLAGPSNSLADSTSNAVPTVETNTVAISSSVQICAGTFATGSPFDRRGSAAQAKSTSAPGPTNSPAITPPTIGTNQAPTMP